MKFFPKRESLPANVQILEIDERHKLAQQVYFRREQQQWTQDELAKMINTTQSQIANIEAGTVNPTLRTLVRLSNAFGCHVRDLFCSTEGHPEMDALRESMSTVQQFLEQLDDRESSIPIYGSGSFQPVGVSSMREAIGFNQMLDQSVIERDGSFQVQYFNANNLLAMTA